jgi:hypothetical protein
MTRRLFLMLSLAVGVAACSSSVTSPSGIGATINGSILALSPTSGPTDVTGAEDPMPAGLVVTIAGSSSQATVDANGHFTLTGVPAGDVVLRFQGTGVNATLTVSAVQSGQTITIVVSIANGSAELASDDRSSAAGGTVQLEGRVDAVPPVSAAGTFIVDGQTVVTNASTAFTEDGSKVTFAALAVGVRVHVSGTTSGTMLLATSVDIQNTNATLPVIVNGIVQAFSGTASSFSFTVDSTLVKGDATTTFTGNSAFTDLANGKRVEVRGLQGNGFVTATSIHVNPH